jgi:hypothetical protein
MRTYVNSVVAIFEKMKWVGSPGGYAVLKPFSLDHDFAQKERSLLFFAESSTWALRYETRDFSGGEKLRALRIAFDDLELYLNRPDVRQSLQEGKRAEVRSLTQLNAS